MILIKIAAVIGILVAGCRMMAGPTPTALTARCRLASDESTALVAYLSKLATATDPATVATRIAYALPVVAATSVVAVTDEIVCAAAADAFNNALDPSNQVAGRSVYVVRVGTVYYVEDPTAGAGEFAMGMTMDANYAVIAGVAG